MLALVNVFFAGLLAGAEVVVRLGVRGPLTVLEARPQIVVRQALIRSLRILVPILFGATAVGLVATVWVEANGWRWAALAALLGWSVVTFTRTVPINKALLAWSPDAPPAGWRGRIERWERLNTMRTVAATAVFVALLVALP